MRPLRLLVSLAFVGMAACSRQPPSTPDADTDVAVADTDTIVDDSDTTVVDTDVADTDVTLTPCPAPSNVGTWFGALDSANVTSDAPTGDAGLAAVSAASVGTVSLAITDAVVTAVAYRPPAINVNTFWIADGSGAIEVFNVDSGTTTLAPGQIVSLTVTKTSKYFGTLQITAATDITVSGSMADVYVLDASDLDLDYATQSAINVFTWGRITAANGACGTSSSCFTMTTNHAQEVRYRVRTDKGVRLGDCIEVVSPLSIYDGNQQLDIVDLDSMEFFP